MRACGCVLPLVHKRCRTLPDRSDQVAASSCVGRYPAATVPTREKEEVTVTIYTEHDVRASFRWEGSHVQIPGLKKKFELSLKGH